MIEIMKSKTNTTMKRRMSQTVLRVLMVLLVLPMAFVNAWAGGGGSSSTAYTYMAVKTSDTGRGLVYMDYKSNYSQSNPPTSDPALSAYQQSYPTGSGTATGDDRNNTYMNTGSHTGPEFKSYFWAKAARGWRFSGWSGYPTGPISFPSGEYSGLLRSMPSLGNSGFSSIKVA